MGPQDASLAPFNYEKAFNNAKACDYTKAFNYDKSRNSTPGLAPFNYAKATWRIANVSYHRQGGN